MIKVLRSLIQERIPLELRFQIELLSRRRDLVNEEKPQELFKLLRDFGIEDIVPLGPGTNRYAFKLHGFVIKVATDHDGKIDNLKEFKMAKRLYPDVTKTYEVSENGTLLVAEYIQPFGSFSEMVKYADIIREKLTKISAVYLIGDVGITSKNYANWGLRVGTDDPVCLDFAYVYEVSSELFICRHCKTNSMLLPNKDFTELYCPSPGCGHHYRFEDIRSRIGNDIHNHEIGDLSKEGYKLTESNVLIELDESRSNYLTRKKKEKPQAQSEVQEVVYEPFIMEHPPKYYLEHKEENKMNIFENSRLAAEDLMREEDSIQYKINNGMVIPAVARLADQKDKIQANSMYGEMGTKDKVPPKTTSESDGVAFSGIMDPSIPVVHATQIPDHMVMAAEARKAVVLQRSDRDVEIPSTTAKVDYSQTPVRFTEGPEYNIPVSKSVPSEIVVQKKAPLFNDNFLNNTEKAFSKLANKIGQHMHELGAMDPVRGNIRDKKMFPETFYKCIQNAVFRSLLIFCDFDEREVQNHNNDGTHKAFIPPQQIEDMPYEPTMIFVSRFWNNRDINSVEEMDNIMIKYYDKFNDYRGLQHEWLPILEQRIMEKLPIDKNGAKKIVELIAANWCSAEEEYPEEIPVIPPVTPTNLTGTHVMETSMEEQSDENLNAYMKAMGINVGPVSKLEVAQNPVDDSEEYEQGDDDEEGDPFSVEIYLEEDDEFDVVRINSGEAYGPISIPFYTKFNDIRVEDTTPSIVDDRNGYWDWLIHMVPDMMFETSDPEKWLEFNECCDEMNQTHVVILEERDGGKYIMGIYFLSGIFIVDEEGVGHPTTDPVILAKLNKIVRDDIGYSSISHLRRSLKMEELIKPEGYISQMVTYEDIDPDDFGEQKEGMAPEESNGEPDMDVEMSETERAAINAVLNQGSFTPTPGTGMLTSIIDEPEVEEIIETRPIQQVQQVEQKPVQQSVQPSVVNKAPAAIPNQPGVFQPIRRNGR